MTFKYLFSLIFIALFSTLGCQSTANNKNQPDEKKSSADLFNIKWILQHSAQDKYSAFMLFKPNGKVSGFSGCNKFFGKMSLSDNKISFSRLATTRKMCSKAMSFESNLISSLSSVNTYKIVENSTIKQLYLYNNHTEVFIFINQ
jgi:heat shock protein HslJ